MAVAKNIRISALVSRTFNVGNYESLRIQLGWEGDVPNTNIEGRYTQLSTDLDRKIQEVYKNLQLENKGIVPRS